MVESLSPNDVNQLAGHPLQTWEWGEFRKQWGNEIVRIKIDTSDKEKQVLLVTFSKIPFTPWKIGTVLKGPKPTGNQLKILNKLGREKRAIFIKLEPNVLKSGFKSSDLNLLNKYCTPGRRLFTPETFWIDLTKSEEDLLKSFSSKTRYNIRLAQKKGVVVREDNSDKAFEIYLKLTFATAKRQKFFAHTPAYHRLMWKYLHQLPVANGKAPMAHLLVAKYNPFPQKTTKEKGQEILTAWIVFVWKDFLYYPYGASSDKYRQVMANNLMMWEAIGFGKSKGLKIFDLWGREKDKGFTRFKEGYNPRVVEFIGSWDLVINKTLYRLYRLAEIFRWGLLRLKTKLLKI